MPDFKKMYTALFREVTKVIDVLQVAQQQAEEIYLSDDTEDNLIVIHPYEDSGSDADKE